MAKNFQECSSYIAILRKAFRSAKLVFLISRDSHIEQISTFWRYTKKYPSYIDHGGGKWYQLEKSKIIGNLFSMIDNRSFWIIVNYKKKRHAIINRFINRTGSNFILIDQDVQYC